MLHCPLLCYWQKLCIFWYITTKMHISIPYRQYWMRYIFYWQLLVMVIKISISYILCEIVVGLDTNKSKVSLKCMWIKERDILYTSHNTSKNEMYHIRDIVWTNRRLGGDSFNGFFFIGLMKTNIQFW